MSFSNGQINLLRSALNRYRMLKGKNGQYRPWKAVLDDIITCPETSVTYDTSGQSEFKENALRCFGEGRPFKAHQRYEDVKTFLLKVGVLSKSAFETGNGLHGEAIAVHDLLGNKGADAKQMRQSYGGLYRSRRTIDGMSEEVFLTFTPDSVAAFFLVEEKWKLTRDTRNSQYHSSRHEVVQSVTRSGYGFPGTSENLLHVFLKGPRPDDSVTYVQPNPMRGFGKDVVMMRFGDAAHAAPSYHGDVEASKRYAFERLERSLVTYADAGGAVGSKAAMAKKGIKVEFH